MANLHSVHKAPPFEQRGETAQLLALDQVSDKKTESILARILEGRQSEGFWKRAEIYLQRHADPEIIPVLSIAVNRNPFDRREILYILAAISDPATIPPLKTVALDQAEIVDTRIVALERIARFGLPETLPIFAEVLLTLYPKPSSKSPVASNFDRQAPARTVAARCIGTLLSGNPPAWPWEDILRAIQNRPDEHPAVRAASGQALLAIHTARHRQIENVLPLPGSKQGPTIPRND